MTARNHEETYQVAPSTTGPVHGHPGDGRRHARRAVGRQALGDPGLGVFVCYGGGRDEGRDGVDAHAAEGGLDVGGSEEAGDAVFRRDVGCDLCAADVAGGGGDEDYGAAVAGLGWLVVLHVEDCESEGWWSVSTWTFAEHVPHGERARRMCMDHVE